MSPPPEFLSPPPEWEKVDTLDDGEPSQTHSDVCIKFRCSHCVYEWGCSQLDTPIEPTIASYTIQCQFQYQLIRSVVSEAKQFIGN